MAEAAAHAPSPLAHHFENLEKQAHAHRLGMWLFLATEVLLFAALFGAYAVYRYLFHHDFIEASRHIETWIGLVNTIVLVTSSFTVALGLHRATQGDGRGAALFFGLSVLMGFVFLGFKAVEYTHHFQEGQLPGRFYTYAEVTGPGASIFFALYFLITGLHGIHVVVGMTVLSVVGIRAARGAFTASWHVPVELAGLYWHLVDLIWIFVFPLIYLI
jgi:cytochrome c oxidase subunit 3